jgi:hypothetical protein
MDMPVSRASLLGLYPTGVHPVGVRPVGVPLMACLVLRTAERYVYA